jgi:hypothetical protein
MDENKTLGRPRAAETILLGWLAVGVLDMLDAYFFFGLRTGASFIRVFQGVAAGLYGSEAARVGGITTGLVGLAMHYVVALGVAVVFYLACRQLRFLYKQPWIWGPLYGIAVHFFMQYVVVPNSAIGTWPKMNFDVVLLNNIVGHALLVGLPLALIANWSAKRNSRIN